MTMLGLLLAVGLALTARWAAIAYVPADPAAGQADVPSARAVALGYGRGAAIGLVGGLWAGLLITGPAVRLVMRLLAVTAGEGAQGRITEADEIVGQIDLDGTIALVVFGGLLPGLVSGLLYVVVRRWLPAGIWGGVAFGALHLVIAATRLDPLRPDNPDFGLVGPGWLAVLTFGLVAVLHGMGVAAFANRYSRAFFPSEDRRRDRRRIVVPLVGPTLIAMLSFIGAVAIVAGLLVALAASRLRWVVDAARSRALATAGRVSLIALAAGFTPGAVSDLRDIVVG